MASAREVLERLRAWLVEQSPAILRRDVAELIDRELAALPEEPAEQPAPRDWPEDASDENGRYECICALCGSRFVGHKRRVACRVCASAPSDGALAEAILCSEPDARILGNVRASELSAMLSELQRLRAAPRASSALVEAVENCLARGYNRPLDDVLDSAASVFEIPPGEWVALLEALAAERSRPADDRDATIAELREKVAGLQSQVDGMADDYQNCAKACSDEEMRAEKAEATIADLREKLRVAELDLVIEKADCEEAEATLATERACHLTKVQAMAWDYAQQVRANDDLRMVAERAERAEATIAELREQLEAAVHEVKRADDKIGAMEYHGNSVHHWWAKARAYYGAYDARDAAVARAEKAEARVAEMEAKAKPEPAGDERLGPWSLRNYLDSYDPFGPTPMESAVAELCRRVLREEADRG